MNEEKHLREGWGESIEEKRREGAKERRNRREKQ